LKIVKIFKVVGQPVKPTRSFMYNSEKSLSEKIGEWFLFLGFAFLGVLIILISMADLDASEVKDTRVFVKGKGFSTMTYFTTCINFCKDISRTGYECKCEVYTEKQMKLLKGEVK
jgi:hypothetical protein